MAEDMQKMAEKITPDMDDVGQQAVGLIKNRKGRPHNPTQVLCCIAFPVLLFAWVLHMMSSRTRHDAPMKGLLWGPGLGLLVFGAFAGQAVSGLMSNHRDRLATALAASFLLAVCTATFYGEQHYRWYMFSYWSYIDMASYVDIDPTYDKGGAYMDSGFVYFKDGAQVLTSSGVAFQNVGIYCAAPIARMPVTYAKNYEGVMVANIPPSGTIDWWAVGKDCCSPSGEDFSCGAVSSPSARSGMRMLRNEIAPMYEMAVQQWSARVGLPAKKPLFFHWAEDPVASVDLLLNEKDNLYGMNVVLFLFGNACFALMTLWALVQLGFP